MEYNEYGSHHDRSVSRERLDHIAEVRTADYEAAKTSEPNVVAEYERRANARRVRP